MKEIIISSAFCSDIKNGHCQSTQCSDPQDHCWLHARQTVSVEERCPIQHRLLTQYWLPNGNKKENQHVNPCVNFTTAAGKSHLRLKSGLTLLELQVTANCSPSLRMTLPFWESVTAGGSSGTGWKDQKQHYCSCWLIVMTKVFGMGTRAKVFFILQHFYWQRRIPAGHAWT